MSNLGRAKLVRVFVGLTLCWILAGPGSAQDLPVSTDRRNGDTNNAVIEGRVTLPSGFSAERNVRITVRNAVTTLYTIYSNKNGEFRFHDMSEGTYYVQA